MARQPNLAFEELAVAVFFDERNKSNRDIDGRCDQPGELVKTIFRGRMGASRNVLDYGIEPLRANATALLTLVETSP